MRLPLSQCGSCVALCSECQHRLPHCVAHSINFSCRPICGRYEKLVTGTEARPRSQCSKSPVIQFSYTHLIFRAAPFAGVMRNWSAYTVTIDPVLVYTFNFSSWVRCT